MAPPLIPEQYLKYALKELPILHTPSCQAQQTNTMYSNSVSIYQPPMYSQTPTYFVPVQNYPDTSLVPNYENGYKDNVNQKVVLKNIFIQTYGGNEKDFKVYQGHEKNNQKSESNKLENIVINKNNFNKRRSMEGLKKDLVSIPSAFNELLSEKYDTYLKVQSSKSGKVVADPQLIGITSSDHESVLVPYLKNIHTGKIMSKKAKKRLKAKLGLKGLQSEFDLAEAVKGLKDKLYNVYSSSVNTDKVKTVPVVAPHSASANLMPSSIVNVSDFITFISSNYGQVDNMKGTFMCNETSHCKKVFDSGTKFAEHIINGHAQTIVVKDLSVNIESYYDNMNVKDVQSCKLPALVADENNKNFCNVDLSPEYEKYIEMRASKRLYCKLCHNFYSSQDLVLQHLSGLKHAVRVSKIVNKA